MNSNPVLIWVCANPFKRLTSVQDGRKWGPKDGDKMCILYLYPQYIWAECFGLQVQQSRHPCERRCCAAEGWSLGFCEMKGYATVLPNVPREISSLSTFRRWLGSADKEITKHDVSTSPASLYRCVVPVRSRGGTARRHYSQKTSRQLSFNPMRPLLSFRDQGIHW